MDQQRLLFSMKHWQKIVLGLGSVVLLCSGYLTIRQPQWMFQWIAQLRPGAVFFMPTDDPVIALTIDDGPQSETTEAILQVLERHGVQATFFMLSDGIAGHEAVLKRLVESGHELGHHMTTDESSIRLSPTEFEARFLQADQVLSAYGDMRWFRPGMGWYSDRMVQMVEANNYQLVLGSLFPYDTHLPSVQFAEWFILNNLDPGDILVLHDGPKNRGDSTLRLLESLLPKIQARGYRIVTLSELDKISQ